MAPPPALRLPQMGWNELVFEPGHPLLDGVQPGDHAYFVHSYALAGGSGREILATTDYGGPIVAMVASRQPGRHPVPRREKPGGRPAHPGQLPSLDPMTMLTTDPPADPIQTVERSHDLSDDDLHDLCEAADAAIIDGGGFGWVNPPGRQALERYFRGVLLVPERELFIARSEGRVVGSAQLVRPPRNNEAQAFAAQLMHSFIAPYARGHGLARLLTGRVEEGARALGYHVLNLDVRDTQEAAIALYESMGYIRWGVHPAYARVRGKTIRGIHYYKLLQPRGRLA